MDCEQAREAILEMFDGDAPAGHAEHIAGCASCAAFLAKQATLDRELAQLFPAPALSPAFRANLQRRMREETTRQRPEVLPDLVHVLTCAIATGICAALLPFDARVVVGIGTLATASTYVLELMVRGWLDA